jgi:hypothetical protein
VGGQASDDWFEVVPATGAVDPETSASLTVRITAKAQELPVGVTLGTLTLQDLTHGVVTTSTVRVEVASGAQIGVAPTSLTATLLMGEATTAPLTVSNAVVSDEALSVWLSVRETSRTLSVAVSDGASGGGQAQSVSALGAPDKATLPPVDFRAAATPNQLLVRFAPSASVPRSGHQVNASAEQVRRRRSRRFARAQIERELPLVPGLCVVNVPPTVGVQESVSVLNASPDILYAEPNYRLTIHETIPNDPNFDLLWGLHNTGQSGGHPMRTLMRPRRGMPPRMRRM